MFPFYGKMKEKSEKKKRKRKGKTGKSLEMSCRAVLVLGTGIGTRVDVLHSSHKASNGRGRPKTQSSRPLPSSTTCLCTTANERTEGVPAAPSPVPICLPRLMAHLHPCDPQHRLLTPLLRKPPTATLRCRSRHVPLLPNSTSFSSSRRLFSPSHPPLNTRSRLPRAPASSLNGAFVQDGSQPLEKRLGDDREDVDLLRKLRELVLRVRSLLPGGSWWDLSEQEVEVKLLAKPVTVWRALTRMWELVAQDRWIIFAAFSALILAAVCGLFTF